MEKNLQYTGVQALEIAPSLLDQVTVILERLVRSKDHVFCSVNGPSEKSTPNSN